MTSPVGIKVRPAGRSVAAFTLVELLAVATIMGLLAGVAAVSLRGMRSPAIASAANEVASAMKMTRQMAIASGRKTYLVFPIATNGLTTNLLRSFAVFQEVPPGESTLEPDRSGTNYPVNTNTTPWHIPKTDWRTLPEGVAFCNLVTGSYSPVAGDRLPTNSGTPSRRLTGQAFGRDDWQYFESFMDFDIRRAENPSTNFVSLTRAPYIGFFPNGRAFYGNPGTHRNPAAIRLVQGFVRGEEIAVTDTNNYYNIEADPAVGRVRVRSRESYQ